MAKGPVIGFVILGGQKIFVSVRQGSSGKWVTTRQSSEGERLERIEAALRKIPNSRERLLGGKFQVLP